MSEPMLILAAMWTDGDTSDDVAKTLRKFKTPDGFNRGQVVSFKRDTADDLGFQLVMRKLQLAEMNERP